MHLGVVSLAPSQRLCPYPECPNSGPSVTNTHPKNAAGTTVSCGCHSDLWGSVGQVTVSHSMPVCLPCSVLILPSISLKGRDVSEVLRKLSCCPSCLTSARWLCSSAPSLQKKDPRTTLLRDSIARIKAGTVVLGTKAMGGWMNMKDYCTFDF